MSYTQVLHECVKIAEERYEDYGDAESNIEDIKTVLQTAFGENLSKDTIIKVFIATKLVREKHKHKKDNLLDLVNYISILQSIK